MAVTNEKIKVLAKYEKVNLKVNYFWDSHDQLILYNDFAEDPTSWTNAEVEILEEHIPVFGFDYVERQLYVNGKLIEGEVNSYSKEPNPDGTCYVYCSVIVGGG